MKWVLVVVGLLAGIGFAVWGRVAESARRRRFSDREAYSLEEWVRRFYPGVIDDGGPVMLALKTLGRSMDVDGGRLRPNDRFGEELALRKFPVDDTAATAVNAVKKQVRLHYGIDLATDEALATVDDLMQLVARRASCGTPQGGLRAPL